MDVWWKISQQFFDVVIWNHPVETTIKKTWLFGVPGAYQKIKTNKYSEVFLSISDP